MLLFARMPLRFFGGILSDKAELAAENIALRQQLAVLRRSVKRPKLKNSDRLFWAWLSRLWSKWRSCLRIVSPDSQRHGNSTVRCFSVGPIAVML